MSTKRLFVFLCLVACQTRQEIQPPPPPPPPDVEPAALSVQAVLSTAQVTVGQQLSLTVTVSNTGKSVALGVTPSPLSQAGTGHVRIAMSQSEGMVDLQPGEQHVFELTLEAADPGALTLSGTVDAMDGPTTAAISAQLPQLELTLESPPLLVISAVHAPLAADVGLPTEITLTVENDGEAQARMVSVQLDAAPGSVAFERVAGPVPPLAQLMAGETQTFTFTVKPNVTGNLLLKAHAFGLDANDMSATVSEEIALPSIGVEKPAKLAAELQLPPVVTGGQMVTATLVVRNDGEALARGVEPVPAIPLATTVSGTASAAASSGPPAQDVPGGSTVTFTWSYVASGMGSFSLSGHVRGVDVNSGVPVEAVSLPATAQVMAASALQVMELSAPSVINPTEGFDLTLKVKNVGGTTANGVLPDPMPPALVPSAGALARLTTSPTAQNLAPGATATFVFHYAENGTGPGTLKFNAGARGTDSATGQSLSAVGTTSNVIEVLPAPALLVELVTPPVKITRGQTFPVEVRVKNTGGTVATGVTPAVAFTPTMYAVATCSPVAAQSIAGGGQGIFSVSCTESGTGPGTLKPRSTATGMNPNFGTTLTAGAVSSTIAALVQEPAALQVITFVLPGDLTRGATFSLGMVVSNSGQADARTVAPTMPALLLTGGVAATLVSGPVSLTVPGGKTRAFTWRWHETGTAAGTLGFRAGATGADANSNAPISVAAVPSNVSPVDVYLGCNGSLQHPSLDGHLLDRDRLDLVAGNDRLRVKGYTTMLGEFTRALGSQPVSIKNQQATFDVPTARWSDEPELSAISLYRVFTASYQACLTLTAAGAQYTVAPTLTTATTECRTWQRRFWSVTPGGAETTACANFAVSADNDGATPHEKWAATCATAAASLGFLAE